MKIIPNTADLKVINLEQLARGTGARYLEVMNSPEGYDTLIACRWRRVIPKKDCILIDLKPEKDNR